MQASTELVCRERINALKTSPFFVVLRHCVQNCPQQNEWRKLANTLYTDCNDLNSTWDCFEKLFLKLSDYLEECDDADVSSTIALQVASDFVKNGEYGLVWLRSSWRDRATALYGLVAASDAVLNKYLIEPVAGASEVYRAPTVATMRAAIEQAGDINGCLMV